MEFGFVRLHVACRDGWRMQKSGLDCGGTAVWACRDLFEISKASEAYPEAVYGGKAKVTCMTAFQESERFPASSD